MAFSFVKFEGVNKRQEERITVTKSRGIGFPKKFFDDNHINDYKYALLYWDKNNLAIGIKLTNDEGEKSKFTILKSKKGFGANIIANSFFKENNIDTQTYHGRYKWEKHNEVEIGELFVIQLKKYEK